MEGTGCDKAQGDGGAALGNRGPARALDAVEALYRLFPAGYSLTVDETAIAQQTGVVTFDWTARGRLDGTLVEAPGSGTFRIRDRTIADGTIDIDYDAMARRPG